MNRPGILVLGVASYVLFLGVFLALIGFLWNVGVPKGIDAGEVGALLPSLLVNLALMALFGVQHSVMARPGFKRAWTAIVPEPAERSIFVLLASLLLVLLMWAWQPLPALVWDCGSGPLAGVLSAVSALGWGCVLLSTFAIDHFHLFGLRQAIHGWLGRPLPETPFRVRGLYRIVRHPLMLGFLIAFWSAPQMSLGRLEFSLGMTLYILIALVHEERDLHSSHGAEYARYAERTPRLNPFGRR